MANHDVPRANVLERILRAVERSKLVTLTGAPGIGKTWLGHQLLAMMDLKSIFVDLRAARTRADGHRAIADALAVRVARLDEDGVAAHLGDIVSARGLGIVILDNFETVADALRPSLQRWLATSRDVRWVATSRRALELPGERRFSVDTLSLPTQPTLDAIRASESGALFLAATPPSSRALVESDSDGLHDLLNGLAGVPLAIRLAAARCGVVSARDVQVHLAQTLLEGPGTPETSLASAMEVSWRLLAPALQEGWAQSSVFVKGFDYAAALDVIQCSLPVVDVLEGLCRASLLERSDDGRRFAHLPVLQAFASGRLGAAARRAALERHARYFTDQALGWHEAAQTGDVEALQRLRRDVDNLQAVTLRADGEELDRRFALPSAYAAGLVIDAQSGATASRQLFDRALERRTDGDERRHLVLVHRYRAESRFVLGDGAGAHEDLLQAELLAQGDAWALGRVNLAMGLVARFAHKLELAEARFTSALRLATEGSDVNGEIQAALNLGIVHRRRGRLAECTALLQQAASLMKRHGLDAFEAEILTQQAIAEHQRGALALSRALIEDALRLAAARGQIAHAIYAEGALAVVCLAADDLAAAEAAGRRGLQLARRHGLTVFEADALGFLGVVADVCGQTSAAQQNLSLAIAAARRASAIEREHLWACALASMTARLGSTAVAARILDDLDERNLDAEGLLLLRLARLQAGAPARPTTVTSRQLARLAREVPAHHTVVRRLVERARREHDRAATGDRTVLRIARDGSWFIPRGAADRIHVGNRQHLSRVLKRLAEGRIHDPGAVISSDILFGSGWPGERIDRSAARTRLYTTISSLRRLGLHDALRRSQNGYQLLPDVPCAIVDTETPSSD